MILAVGYEERRLSISVAKIPIVCLIRANVHPCVHTYVFSPGSTAVRRVNQLRKAPADPCDARERARYIDFSQRRLHCRSPAIHGLSNVPRKRDSIIRYLSSSRPHHRAHMQFAEPRRRSRERVKHRPKLARYVRKIRSNLETGQSGEFCGSRRA